MEGNRRFRSSSGRPFSRKGKPFRKRKDENRSSGKADDSNEHKPGYFKSSGKPFERRERPFRKGGPPDRTQRFKKEGGSAEGERSFRGGPKKSFSQPAPGKYGKRFSNGPQKDRYSSDRSGKFDKGKSGEARERRSSDDRDGGKKFSKGGYRQGPPRERKSFVESRVEKQQVQQGREKQEAVPGDGLIRLNRYISNSGVCSRREADDLITAGLITVNGKSVTELGFKVKLTDDVRYEGKRLKAEKPVYILLNKPKGYITTTDDPQERNTVMQLIQGACKERVYPVGRLDRNTSGLLLLTNDGDLTEKLTHPSHNVKKIYKAELDRPLTKNDFQKVLEGVRLEEGKAIVDDLAIVSDDGKTVGLEIHIGWNRLVRRIFESLGYEVTRLDRSAYASLTKKELSRGHWRFLRPDEVIRLKHFL